jgi:mRNA interferase MazF
MVNKWDIFLCALDPTVGSEQKGTRPVLVISNNAVNHNLPVATVIPFSSIKTGAVIYPTEVEIPTSISGLQMNSVVMVQQIRTVSHDRLVKNVSHLNDLIYQAKILEAIREYFEYA